jgi:hypothetical protein
MILVSGIFMASRTIDGQLISLSLGDETSLPQDQSPKTMNNISPQTIPNPSENVPHPQPPPHRLCVLCQRLMVDCVAVGSALVAHFSYYWQNEIGNRTDVLDRYKALVIDRAGSDLLQYYD